MRVKGNLAADAALVLTTMLWGSTFVITKDLLDYWPPISYLTIRFIIASILLIILFHKQFFAARASEWRAGIMLGLLIGLGMALQSSGLIYTTPSKSAFITGLTTPLVPFVALALFRVRPNLENLMGVTLASAGGVLILAPREGNVNTGDLLTLGSLLLFAAHITLLSDYTKRFDVRQVTVLQIVSATLVFILLWLSLQTGLRVVPREMLPDVIQRETLPLVWPGRVVWQLIYMSTVATLGTFLLWSWGQARMSATHAAIIFSLEPVFATLFAVAVRGRSEWMGGRGSVGAALILAGVIISEIRLRDRKGALAAEGDQDISIEPVAGR